MDVLNEARSPASKVPFASRVGAALAGIAMMLPTGCSRESEKVESGPNWEETYSIKIDWDPGIQRDLDWGSGMGRDLGYESGIWRTNPDYYSDLGLSDLDGPFAGASLPDFRELPVEKETPQLYTDTFRSVVDGWRLALDELACAEELSEFWKNSDIDLTINSDVAKPGSGVEAVATPPLSIKVDAEAFSRHCAVALAETVGKLDPQVAINLYTALLPGEEKLTPKQEEERLHEAVLVELRKLEGEESKLAEFHKRLAQQTLGVVTHELTHLRISSQMKEELGFDFPLACRDEEILCFVAQAQVETALYDRGVWSQHNRSERLFNGDRFGSGISFMSYNHYDAPIASEVVQRWRGGLEGLRAHVEGISRYAALPMLSELDEVGDYRAKIGALSDNLNEEHSLQVRIQEMLEGYEQGYARRFSRAVKSEQLESMVQAFKETEELLADPERVQAVAHFYRLRLEAAAKLP